MYYFNFLRPMLKLKIHFKSAISWDFVVECYITQIIVYEDSKNYLVTILGVKYDLKRVQLIHTSASSKVNLRLERKNSQSKSHSSSDTYGI